MRTIVSYCAVVLFALNSCTSPMTSIEVDNSVAARTTNSNDIGQTISYSDISGVTGYTKYAKFDPYYPGVSPSPFVDVTPGRISLYADAYRDLQIVHYNIPAMLNMDTTVVNYARVSFHVDLVDPQHWGRLQYRTDLVAGSLSSSDGSVNSEYSVVLTCPGFFELHWDDPAGGTATISNIKIQFQGQFRNFSQGSFWSNDFGTNASWANNDVFPRVMADIDKDGYSDIVGFGSQGVFVALSNRNKGFKPGALVLNSCFGLNQGWSSNSRYPRMMADVNGDAYPDIVGFASNGVIVALNNQHSGFNTASIWLTDFGTDQTWTSNDAYPRMMADMNHDGFDDIVGFGSQGVFLSLNSTHGGFLPGTLALSTCFGLNQGWSSHTQFPRMMADINKDGFQDIVGFASNGVIVALNNRTGGFKTPQVGLKDFGTDQSWTSNDLYPRMVADVNGDGYPDVVGFGSQGVFVALNNRESDILATSFSGAEYWLADFGRNQTWVSNGAYPRVMARANGDRSFDIVGFASQGVVISTATLLN